MLFHVVKRSIFYISIKAISFLCVSVPYYFFMGEGEGVGFLVEDYSHGLQRHVETEIDVKTTHKCSYESGHGQHIAASGHIVHLARTGIVMPWLLSWKGSTFFQTGLL